jgi:hypothetical protein
MTRSAVDVLEARLASPEMRRQVDALVAQAMENLHRNSDATVRALVKAAGGTLEVELRRVATVSTIKKSTHDNYVGPWFSNFLKRRGL